MGNFLQTFNIAVANIQWNDAHKPERAIYQPPEYWDAANAAGDKGQWKYGNAGDHPELDDPDVFNWIAQWTNK